MSKLDLNHYLHNCRSLCISKIPAAKTVLSVGSAGSWYFEWFNKNYPHSIDKHIGIDLNPKPTDLPENIRWIQQDCSDLSQISSNSIELVFAGQVIEHMSWEKQFQFLLEVRRVLVPDGLFVLDSPNFRISNRYGWKQPEHVCELSFHQINTILSQTKFRISDTYGILPTAMLGEPQKKYGKYLDSGFKFNLADEESNNCVTTDPENAFIWWIVSRKIPGYIDSGKIYNSLRNYYLANEAEKTMSIYHQIGSIIELGEEYFIDISSGMCGFALFGPYENCNPGKYSVVYTIILSDKFSIKHCKNDLVCTIDVSNDGGNAILTKKELTFNELNKSAIQQLEFQLDAPTIIEFRVFSHGFVGFKTSVCPKILKI